MSEGMTLALSQPIQAHGEKLNALTFRALTGADIRRAGIPFRLRADGSIDEIHTEIVFRYASLLAQVPVSSLDQLTPADTLSVVSKVVDFFTQAMWGAVASSIPKTSSTPTTPPPAGGGTIAASLG